MFYEERMEVFDLIAYGVDRVGIVITCDQVASISSLGFDVEDYFVLEVPRVGVVEIRCLRTIASHYDITHLSRESRGIQERLDYYMNYRSIFSLRPRYSTILLDCEEDSHLLTLERLTTPNVSRKESTFISPSIKTIRFKTYSTLRGLRDIYIDNDMYLMDLKGKMDKIDADTNTNTESYSSC